MKNNYIPICLFVTGLLWASSYSQESGKYDKVIKKDKTAIEGKVLRVTDTAIEIDPKGPIPFIIVPRNEVDAIVYSDNTVVKMDQAIVTTQPTNSGLGNPKKDERIVLLNPDGKEASACWLQGDDPLLGWGYLTVVHQCFPGPDCTGIDRTVERSIRSDTYWFQDSEGRKELRFEGSVKFCPFLGGGLGLLLHLFDDPYNFEIQDTEIRLKLIENGQVVQVSKQTVEKIEVGPKKELRVTLEEFSYRGIRFCASMKFNKVEKGYKSFNFSVEMPVILINTDDCRAGIKEEGS